MFKVYDQVDRAPTSSLKRPKCIATGKKNERQFGTGKDWFVLRLLDALPCSSLQIVLTRPRIQRACTFLLARRVPYDHVWQKPEPIPGTPPCVSDARFNRVLRTAIALWIVSRSNSRGILRSRGLACTHLQVAHDSLAHETCPCHIC